MRSEQAVVDALVTLGDTLVDEFDVIDFLHQLSELCVELLDVSAAGIMLADPAGQLRHGACSSEAMQLVELFELQIEEGPCFDAYRTARAVSASVDETAARWPDFAEHARATGFASVAAVPMRLRTQVIGALNLLSVDAEALGADDVRLAQAMADMATIGILQERTIRDARTLAEQLNTALSSRIVIEQAKGVVAEHNHVDMDAAFQLIRAFARGHNQRLSTVALDLTSGALRPTELFAAPHRTDP